jgi:hypothetical protein
MAAAFRAGATPVRWGSRSEGGDDQANGYFQTSRQADRSPAGNADEAEHERARHSGVACTVSA